MGLRGWRTFTASLAVHDQAGAQILNSPFANFDRTADVHISFMVNSYLGRENEVPHFPMYPKKSAMYMRVYVGILSINVFQITGLKMFFDLQRHYIYVYK